MIQIGMTENWKTWSPIQTIPYAGIGGGGGGIVPAIQGIRPVSLILCFSKCALASVCLHSLIQVASRVVSHPLLNSGYESREEKKKILPLSTHLFWKQKGIKVLNEPGSFPRTAVRFIRQH